MTYTYKENTANACKLKKNTCQCNKLNGIDAMI